MGLLDFLFPLHDEDDRRIKRDRGLREKRRSVKVMDGKRKALDEIKSERIELGSRDKGSELEVLEKPKMDPVKELNKLTRKKETEKDQTDKDKYVKVMQSESTLKVRQNMSSEGGISENDEWMRDEISQYYNSSTHEDDEYNGYGKWDYEISMKQENQTKIEQDGEDRESLYFDRLADRYRAVQRLDRENDEQIISQLTQQIIENSIKENKETEERVSKIEWCQDEQVELPNFKLENTKMTNNEEIKKVAEEKQEKIELNGSIAGAHDEKNDLNELENSVEKNQSQEKSDIELIFNENEEEKQMEDEYEECNFVEELLKANEKIHVSQDNNSINSLVNSTISDSSSSQKPSKSPKSPIPFTEDKETISYEATLENLTIEGMGIEDIEHEKIEAEGLKLQDISHLFDSVENDTPRETNNSKLIEDQNLIDNQMDLDVILENDNQESLGEDAILNRENSMHNLEQKDDLKINEESLKDDIDHTSLNIKIVDPKSDVNLFEKVNSLENDSCHEHSEIKPLVEEFNVSPIKKAPDDIEFSSVTSFLNNADDKADKELKNDAFMDKMKDVESNFDIPHQQEDMVGDEVNLFSSHEVPDRESDRESSVVFEEKSYDDAQHYISPPIKIPSPEAEPFKSQSSLCSEDDIYYGVHNINTKKSSANDPPPSRSPLQDSLKSSFRTPTRSSLQDSLKSSTRSSKESENVDKHELVVYESSDSFIGCSYRSHGFKFTLPSSDIFKHLVLDISCRDANHFVKIRELKWNSDKLPFTTTFSESKNGHCERHVFNIPSSSPRNVLLKLQFSRIDKCSSWMDKFLNRFPSIRYHMRVSLSSKLTLF